jgi:hypothetical protein
MFKYAAGAAALVVILLALVLVPKSSWDAATTVALVLLATSVALLLAIPKSLTGHGKSEVGSLATIGLSGVVLTGYFILSLAAFAFAAFGMNRTFVWADVVISGGWLVIGSLVSRGSVQYLDNAFPDKAQSVTTRSMIMAELSAIRSNCPEQFADNLDHLLEKIRYSANDLSEAPSAENESILALLTGDLRTSCRANDPSAFRKTILELEEKISGRDVRLKAARSKV